MKLVGLMPVRNEAWCLGLTLRAALMWCDEVEVLLHACTDQSLNIVADVARDKPNRVTYTIEDNPTWREMFHRDYLLRSARRYETMTHVAMIDADEVLTGNMILAVRALIQMTAPGTTLQLPWLALPRMIDRYLTSGIWGPGQQVSMAFKDQPEAHWASRNGYDFHHRNPMGLPAGAFRAPLQPHQGGIMHLQFLNERRLRAKQALYQCTEVLRWPGRKTPAELRAMYGRAVYESDPMKHASAEIPADWWARYAGLMQYLDLSDSEPWQETELKRLLAEHGRERFAGLDLFGVCQ